MNRRHPARVGAFLLVVAIGLAACGGASSASPDEEPSSAESAAASAGASTSESTAASLEESAEASMPGLDLGNLGDVSELDSYQLEISYSGADGEQVMTILATRNPVNATHYTISGELELISIEGEGAWMNQGGTWVEAPGGEDSFLPFFDALAPDTLITTYALDSYNDFFQHEGTEEKNGVQAVHYHLDASTAEALGGEFPEDGTVDVWVAADGSYLVGMAYAATDPVSGDRDEFSIDVSRVNDPSISIEPPV